MKKTFLFLILQLTFLVGFSQTDTIATVSKADTIKVVNKNEIGIDVSPLLIKAMSLDRLPRQYVNANSFNVFYKRHLTKNQYLRVGFNVVDKSLYYPNFSFVNVTTFTNSPILTAGFSRVKSQEVYGYFGYEKRFAKNYIQPFISLDVMAGKFNTNIDMQIYNLNDTLYPSNNTISGTAPLPSYNNGSTNLVKYEQSTSYNYSTIGLLFRAGFMVDVSKRLYLLMQTGGSMRMLFSGNITTYSNYNSPSTTKLSTFNFELLRNNTNLMIGYRF